MRPPAPPVPRRPPRPRARGNAADLSVRGAEAVGCAAARCGRPSTAMTTVLAAAWAALGGLDAALVAHGMLPDQAAMRALGRRDAARVRHQRRVGDRAADAAREPLRGAGQRRDRRDLVAGRRSRPGQQLRLRRGKGGGHGVRVGAAQAPAREGRPRRHDQARLRRHADDRRHRQGAAVGGAGTGRARHRTTRSSAASAWSTRRGSGARS